MANVSVKCGTAWKPTSTGPICSVADGSYSLMAKAFSISASVPQVPARRRNAACPPGGT